ncbi:MAG: glycosyltransferase [Planctomycetaceae bacterium]|nr:glycosyltransferase [Planctomycetaceae bacterium]
MDRRSIEYWESVTGQRNVTWIPHGVDVDYFRPLMSRSVGPFRVVFAGQHDRDFEALSQVVRTVAERTSDIHFVLIGKHQQLKELASQVPNAVQVENLTDEEYLKALQEADLLLLPLLSSTVCNVVLEGMACGTPVVTTGGGIEDYLEDESAVVVLKGDVEGMVDAILVQADVRSGHKLSSHSARRQSERFSWSEVSRRHVELYASALQ